MNRHNRKQCTECGAHNTERVHVERHTDLIEEVRICHECPTQYLCIYHLEDKRTQETG